MRLGGRDQRLSLLGVVHAEGVEDNAASMHLLDHRRIVRVEVSADILSDEELAQFLVERHFTDDLVGIFGNRLHALAIIVSRDEKGRVRGCGAALIGLRENGFLSKRYRSIRSTGVHDKDNGQQEY